MLLQKPDCQETSRPVRTGTHGEALGARVDDMHWTFRWSDAPSARHSSESAGGAQRVGDDGGRLVENPGFLRFASHWCFRIRAYRPFRVQSKGTVGRPV